MLSFPNAEHVFREWEKWYAFLKGYVEVYVFRAGSWMLRRCVRLKISEQQVAGVTSPSHDGTSRYGLFRKTYCHRLPAGREKPSDASLHSTGTPPFENRLNATYLFFESALSALTIEFFISKNRLGIKVHFDFDT